MAKRANSNYHTGGPRVKEILALDEKVVQTIVQKLGYTEEEVRKYVANDKNSFVGVLYQKLLED